MSIASYWWPNNPDICTFTAFYGRYVAYATWAPKSAGGIWVHKIRSLYHYDSSHRQVPDLFAILHGIGLYDGN